MLSVYNSGQGIVVWQAKLQVTKVLPRGNYYARGEDVGGGWCRNAHLPRASPGGSCSHLQFHQLTHIWPHVLHCLFRVKALDWLSFHSAQTLNITHCNPPRNCDCEFRPAWHSLRTFGECTSGIERREGDGEPVFLKNLKENMQVQNGKRRRFKLPPARYKPGLCLQKLPGWLSQPLSSEPCLSGR